MSERVASPAVAPPSPERSNVAPSARSSSAERELLRESFELALERDDGFPRLFYDVLFHRHPEIEQLFGEVGRGRNTINAQRRMFGQTLIAIVDHYDDPVWLQDTLAPLGRAHLGYGVTPVMYDHVADALLTAFAEVCAADWTPAHEAAWREAYDAIAGIMLAAAERPEGT